MKGPHNTSVRRFSKKYADREKLYLVIPKSDTFTSLFSETRQLRAACKGQKHRVNCHNWDTKVCCEKCLLRWFTLYQISVDEVGALEVRHALADIQTHPQHHVLRQMPLPGSQVVGQTAVLHELEHQTHGRTLGAHTVELNQLTMRQPPVKKKHTHTDTHFWITLTLNSVRRRHEVRLHHDSSLFYKLVVRHALLSYHLHCHLPPVPRSLQHQPKLAAAYLLAQGQLVRVHLPLICGAADRRQGRVHVNV